jgi:dynein heavy chain
MMFEVDDLSFASPATVSRCGMVFLEPHQLGHTVLITSYLNKLKTNFPEKLMKKISEEFHFLADFGIMFALKHLKFPQPTNPNYLVDNMIKLFDTFMRDWQEEGATIPNDAEEKMLNSLIFAMLWSIGGQSDEHTRASYDVFIQELIAGEDIVEKYSLDPKGDGYPDYEMHKISNKFPGDGSLYDFFFDRDNLSWMDW